MLLFCFEQATFTYCFPYIILLILLYSWCCCSGSYHFNSGDNTLRYTICLYESNESKTTTVPLTVYSIECKHVVVSTHYKNASTFIMRLMNVCVRCVCELKRRVRTHKYKQIVCVDVWCWWSEYNKNDVESACGKCMAGTRRWLFINRKCTFWNVLHFTRMIMFLAKIALNPFHSV